MDRLDKYVEDTLIPAYMRGKRRKANAAYDRAANLSLYYRKKGQLERAEALRRAAQQHPSQDPNDPGSRRLRYIRYADGTPVQAWNTWGANPLTSNVHTEVEQEAEFMK
jgi:hypothetical protein